MGTTYATAAEVKSKNSAIELTHSDDEILELVEAASRWVDAYQDLAEGFYGDGIPKNVKAATITLAIAIFYWQSHAGESAGRIGDRAYTVATPEKVEAVLRTVMFPLHPQSLI